MPKYTAEEVATLVVMRSAGKSYEEINEVLTEKFGVSRKSGTLSAKYNSIISSKDEKQIDKKAHRDLGLKIQTINSEKDWRNENATRRQLRTLAALTSSQATIGERMALADSFEQKGMTKGEASDLIQLNMDNPSSEPVKPTKKRIVPTKEKKSVPSRWTKDNENLLVESYNNNLSWKEIAVLLGRTANACKVRRSNMISNGSWPSPPITSEVTIEESYETSWTHSQDMNILVNFYEMSIDEVREAFARPYWVVAQRLEMLFDSTEAEHIAMLMEASDIVLKRKSPRTEKPRKPSRKERRAAKKAERRASKVARFEAKVERKLNRLRGE